MATIGQALLSPETGWQRFDERTPSLVYAGTWTVLDGTGYNGAGEKYTNVVGSSLSFSFIGTKLRVIGTTYNNRSQIIKITIDGVSETFSQYDANATSGTTAVKLSLSYEKTGLLNQKHNVKIELTDANYVSLDAFDIDSTGALVQGQIGVAYTAPEAGWKRYEQTSPSLLYLGTGWTTDTTATNSGGSEKYTNTLADNKIKFSFVGTKLRFIAAQHSSHSASVSISIDGVVETFTQYQTSTTAVYQVLQYEKTNLNSGTHLVEIFSTVTTGIRVDAIDIDSTGRLLHPDEVTDPKDLTIGKRIRANYKSAISGAVGSFSGLGQETKDFIPAASSATPDGDFYLIAVDYERHSKRLKLLADRNIQNAISWDFLNTVGIASGSGLSVDTTATSVPTMTGNTAPEGIASASGIYSTSFDAWKAFDGLLAANAWSTPANTPTGWLAYEFVAPKKITSYAMTSRNPVNNILEMPKDWTFEGWDETLTQWIVLDTRQGVAWVQSVRQTFSFQNSLTFKKYRINVTSNGGSFTNNYIAIGEFAMMEKSSDKFSTTVRLPTGGTISTDKDNEWDNYVVNSTLNETITAGDNAVWNWNVSFYSWTSTTGSASGSKVIRGYNSSTTWTQPSSGGTSATSNLAFRPIFIIEQLAITKYLIQDGTDLKKHDGTAWTVVGSTPATADLLKTNGMDDLTLLNRGSKVFTYPMTDNGVLGVGKTFKRTLDLSKLIEITKITPKGK